MENYNKIEKNEYVTYYYLNNRRHRIDGPAIEYSTGIKYWYQNGKLHRLDGPAIEWYNGDKVWYYKDKYIECNSQEEFERIIKLKLFW
jgi:hypothetical protein